MVHMLLVRSFRRCSRRCVRWGWSPFCSRGWPWGRRFTPSPPTRPVSDLDILIERSQVGVVKQVLQARGYRDMGLDPDQHQAFTNHLHVWHEYPGENKVAIEAHWNLVHDPAYARQIDLAGVRRGRSGSISGLPGVGAGSPGPVDSRLRASAPAPCRKLAQVAARSAVVGGAVWRDVGLGCGHGSGARGPSRRRSQILVGSDRSLVRAVFASEPGRRLAAVQPAALDSHILLRPAEAIGGSGRVFGAAWGSAGWRGRLVYIGETFFPPWAYMQYRYQAPLCWSAPFYYGWRLVRAGLVVFRGMGMAAGSRDRGSGEAVSAGWRRPVVFGPVRGAEACALVFVGV